MLVLLISSCTAYRNNYKAGTDSPIGSEQIKNLKVDDKVSLKLITGQSFTGKVVSIQDEFLVVKVKKKTDQTVYFKQISRIKYEVNKPVTALKVTGSLVLVAIILYLLFPPNFSGFGLSI